MGQLYLRLQSIDCCGLIRRQLGNSVLCKTGSTVSGFRIAGTAFPGRLRMSGQRSRPFAGKHGGRR